MSGEMITAEELEHGTPACPIGSPEWCAKTEATLARALALLKRVQTAFDHGAPFPADRLLRDDIDAFLKEVG